MANFNVTDFGTLSANISTANGTTANDSMIFQNSFVLTPDQMLNLTTPTDTSGTLRFRSLTGNLFTLTVQNDLVINDATTASIQPSFTIGPFVLQIGNGGTAGSITGNIRADDSGVLAFNRSVNTTFSNFIALEEEDNGVRNDVAGTLVTLDGANSGGISIRSSIGTTQLSAYDATLGGAGDGRITGIIMDGGTAHAGNVFKDGAGTWTLAGANTYTGLTTVSEGVLRIENAIGLGTTDAGTVVEDGGTLALAGGLAIGAEQLTLEGEGATAGTETIGALHNASGANSYAGAITLAGDATITSEAGTLTLTGGINGALPTPEITSFVLTLDGDGEGVIDNSNSEGVGIAAGVTGLIKEGDGVWTLADVNTYTGATTINAGTLSVTGSIASSATTVNDGGSLIGSGTLGSVLVNDGGSFSAGVGIGSITTGDFTMVEGATFHFDLGGLAAGTGYDQTAVNGLVSLNDATLDIELIEGFAPEIGDTYTLILNDGADSVEDEFDGLEEGESIIVGEHQYTITYEGGDGNDVVLEVTNADPIATNDVLALIQRTTAGGNVITGGVADSDLEGGMLAVVSVSIGDDDVEVQSTGSTTIEGAHGVLTISANGEYTYDANVEGGVTVGDTAVDTFTYTISDGQEGEAEATLTVTVTGSSTGAAGANTFLLTGTGTTATGLGGDDLYYVDGANDVVIEAANDGTDTVRSSVSYTLSANVENLVLTGAAAVSATGNALANALTGTNGANMLNGLVGADTMTGLGGDDTYYVDNAGDQVVEAANGGTDTVRSSIDYTLGANVENLTLTGGTALNATGNALANKIEGTNNANVLIGGAGADTMTGFGGNDTYYVDSSGDRVVEDANSGIDRVKASVSHALGANVENLQLTGTAISGIGNNLANVIQGTNGDNILNGGLGNDTLTGGAGADRFTFSTELGANNVDAILDFNHVADTIRIDDAVFRGLSVGNLSSDAFWSGAGVTAAHDGADRIIYNSTTGDLFFDRDGTGTTYAAVKFANLANHPTDVAFNDFVVV